MKRILSVLLICVLLTTPLCACAEEPVFTLRNGYAWGMTRAEVIALNEAESLGQNLFVNDYPTYENVPIGEFTAVTARFIFDEEGLYRITYYFQELTSEQYDDVLSMENAMKDEIISYYGEYDRLVGRTTYVWRRDEIDISLRITNYAERGIDRGDFAHRLFLTFSRGDGDWYSVSDSTFDVEYDGSLRNGY